PRFSGDTVSPPLPRFSPRNSAVAGSSTCRRTTVRLSGGTRAGREIGGIDDHSGETTRPRYCRGTRPSVPSASRPWADDWPGPPVPRIACSFQRCTPFTNHNASKEWNLYRPATGGYAPSRGGAEDARVSLVVPSLGLG